MDVNDSSITQGSSWGGLTVSLTCGSDVDCIVTAPEVNLDCPIFQDFSYIST